MKQQVKAIKAKTKQLENIPPEANPFNYDMTRMGTRIGHGRDEEILAMYVDQELKERKVILVDTLTGVRLEVQLPMLTWGQLQNVIETSCYDNTHYAPYAKHVAGMGKCKNCSQSDLGYIGMKRARYHWKYIPEELHFGLCPECEAVHFVSIKKDAD